jgi:glutamyl-tRNA synthetase
MDVLTVAAKANATQLLPSIAAVSCVQQSSPKSTISISYQDTDSVGTQGAVLELKTVDGISIYDDDIPGYLRDKYTTLQYGNRQQVCTLLDLISICVPPAH